MVDSLQSTSSVTVLYDAALTLPEQDRLGRKGFARFLAQSILAMDASEPFVFAVQGSWGSGKSTVLNFVRFFLQNPKLLGETYSELPPIVIVNFNPWWFSGTDQLLAEFFRQFRIQIGRQADPAGKLKELSSRLDLFSKLLTPVSWIPSLGGVAEAAKKGVEVATRALGSAADALTKDVNQSKEEICSILKSQAFRILVVLDDLDRLRPEELRQVFQVVKAVADFPKTIYLLSYDQSAVIGSLGKAGVHAPAQYLEKIVQAPFDLPEPDNVGLRRLTAEYIDKLNADTPKELWDAKRWREFYFGGLDTLIRGPRDVKRLFNALRPAYPPVRGEVDLVDFIAIHSVRIFAPSMYQFIAGNKGLLTNSELKIVLDENAEREARRKLMQSALETVRAEDREALDRILGVMFPVWDPRAGRRSFNDGSYSRWRVARRVCSADVFDFYFRLSVPEGALASSEVRSILGLAANPPDLCSVMARLLSETAYDGDTKLKKFLEYAHDYIKTELDTALVTVLLTAIFSCGDRLCSKLERQTLPFYSNDWQLLNLTEAVLYRITEGVERLRVLTEVMRDGEALSLMVLAVSVWREGSEKAEGSGRPPLFDNAAVEQLGEIVLEKIERAASDGTLRSAPYLNNVLRFWVSAKGVETVKAYATSLASEESGLADLIVAALSNVLMSSEGIRFQSSPRLVTECTDLSPESVATQCEQWLRDGREWMTDVRRVGIETFVDAVRNPRDEFGFRRVS